LLNKNKKQKRSRMLSIKNKALIATSVLLLSVNIYAMDITERLKDSLTQHYSLDQNAVESIVAKMQPLIEKAEHHTVLSAFIQKSEMHFENRPGDIPSDEPLPEDDAVIAAPKYHHVLGENDKVRVLWGTMQKGETEPMHRHYWAAFVMMIQGTTYQVKYADGSQAKKHLPTGLYVSLPHEQAAAYTNLGAMASFLRFELKE
jgi:hypothetical protein